MIFVPPWNIAFFIEIWYNKIEWYNIVFVPGCLPDIPGICVAHPGRHITHESMSGEHYEKDKYF